MGRARAFRRRLIVGLLVLAAGAHAPLRATAAPAADLDAVRRFVDSQRRVARIPGVGLAIVRRDGPVLTAGFGDADEAGRPVTDRTPFVLGSVTKTITALAVAQLVDAGRVRFDDPVRRHVLHFSLRDPEVAERITLRHLLTHTSGLSQWSGHDLEAQQRARFDHLATVRPPGKAFEYSSLNYVILGQVVQAASGVSYAEYLRRNVFGPLDMSADVVPPDATPDPDRARGGRYVFGFTAGGGLPSAPAPLVPAGFVQASARDIGNLLSMLLAEGTFQGRRIVSPDSVKAMLTPWHGGASGPGMAWGIGRTQIGHAGNAQCFSARVALLPAEGYGVAVLTNVNSGPLFPGSADLMDGTVRILRGGAGKRSFPRELLFKAALLLSVLWSLARVARTGRLWARLGFPTRPSARRAAWVRLAVEVVLAAAVLIALPRWLGVPLAVLLEYFPDLGWSMVAGAAAGVVDKGVQTLLPDYFSGALAGAAKGSSAGGVGAGSGRGEPR